jgi:hypothetical protein
LYLVTLCTNLLTYLDASQTRCYVISDLLPQSPDVKWIRQPVVVLDD